MKPNYTTESPFIPLVEDHYQNTINLERNRAIAAEARKSARLLAIQKKKKCTAIMIEGLFLTSIFGGIGCTACLATALGYINTIVGVILGSVFLLVSGFVAGSAYERSMNV